MHWKAFAAGFVVLTSLAVWAPTSASAAGSRGAVYVLTNAPGGNAVVAFDRAADGLLHPAGTFPTGGDGSGGGLGSQGALVLSDNGRLLFAVNAGNDSVSSFTVQAGGLRLVSTIASGGSHPLSVTYARGLLYVLNGGTPNGISGFAVQHDGRLTPLAGSTRPLSAASTGPAQVQFDPDGRVLVVTEKATNIIDTYTIGADGIASGPTVHASAGATPFGFAFDQRGDLVVSDAFGGAPGAGALSSYSVSAAGGLTTITGVVPDGQGAPCWVVTTNSSRYAYTTNTASGTVSSYAIARDGSITLLDAIAATTGAAPTDAALSGSAQFLFTLDSAAGHISGFAVAADGSLAALGSIGGLPLSAVGLAAR